MKAALVSAVLVLAGGLALAKLPPLDDAAKAKAAEAAAKAAWQAKVDGYQLCKVQDKLAAAYKGKAPAKDPKAAAAPPASAPAAKPAVAAASAAVPAASGTAAAPGTPVASAPPTPCTDPGPFAYNPPEQKPLETSEAHSPSGTAAGPPSVKASSAEMAPKK